MFEVRRTISKQRRRILLALGMAVLPVEACDGSPPTYSTQETQLRLVPRVGTIGANGGDVFVLVELTIKADQKAIVFVEARDASLVALPGPALCPTGASPAAGGTAGVGTSGTGGGLDIDDKSGATTGTRVVIPAAALLKDTARTGAGSNEVRETGVVVSIPSGARDALLVASAYTYSGDAEDCSPPNVQLAAVASTTITRLTPGSGGTSSTGGDAPVEGGQPPIGGSGGSSPIGGAPDAGSPLGGAPVGGEPAGGEATGGDGGGSSGAAGVGGGIQ